MALHHRREMPDMRSVYQQKEMGRRRSPSSSNSDSDRSYRSGSVKSHSTAPTSYSGSSSRRPPHVQWRGHAPQGKDAAQQYFEDRQMQESPASSPSSSVETYASTVDSEQDYPEETPGDDVPEYPAPSSISPAIPATQEEFTQLFPTARPLQIRHDDSTLDGNMNLRLDADIGPECVMTLFHLRLQDLKHREFSLRRYCRNSGRELCHSVRKPQSQIAPKRPGVQRSLSNALQSMRPKSERRYSATPTLASLKRHDSGYGSMHSVDFDQDYRPSSAGHDSLSDVAVDTSLVKLEFSNYSQVEVKRSGSKANKRYSFEYWGVPYVWRKVIRKQDSFHRTAYHLTTVHGNKTVAYIEPVKQSESEREDERRRGGWIPPCSMRIVDDDIIRRNKNHGKDDQRRKDVADVVVASGLVALVDDSIRSHFHAEDSKQLLIPVSKLNIGIEYVGPRRLISEMFGRRDVESQSHSRPSSSGGGPTSAGHSSAGVQRPSASRRPSSRGQR